MSVKKARQTTPAAERRVDLRNKVAVITGGASGIGYAMAERFARDGMKLVLADIEDGALQQAAATLREGGAEVIGVRTDVARYADLEALAACAVAAFGKVHLLCNNAGVSITGPAWEFSLDDWRWVMEVNVHGVIHGVKAFLPGMLAHGEPAHIVNTGSLASFNAIGDHAPYCTSKFAVLGFSQSLYAEMKARKTNVGVSILAPGMVDTGINRSWRNRPEGDKPWSDREFADERFMAHSDAFQGAGIPATEVAERVCEAVRDDRFYIFTEEGAPAYVAATGGRAFTGENPYVTTWGEDRRSEAERGTPPWISGGA